MKYDDFIKGMMKYDNNFCKNYSYVNNEKKLI